MNLQKFDILIFRKNLIGPSLYSLYTLDLDNHVGIVIEMDNKLYLNHFIINNSKNLLWNIIFKTNYKSSKVALTPVENLKNDEYSKKELQNLNQQLIALEKSFISDQGMYFGSWYKSLYASSDPFSGYAAWILPGLEYEIALKSSDRLQEWDSRYTNAINSFTLKMRQLILDLK